MKEAGQKLASEHKKKTGIPQLEMLVFLCHGL